MQNWSRLILPLGLGIAAAAMNASAMHDRLQPDKVLAVRREIAAGERITSDDLESVEIPGNAGNLRHFWLEHERDQLLTVSNAAVNLQAGDLVPRDHQLRSAQPRFLVPEDHVVICLRLNEGVIDAGRRHQLRPRRPVSIRLQHEETPLSDVQLAFLELIPAGDAGSNDLRLYQAGLIIQNDPELLTRITKHGIASMEGISD